METEGSLLHSPMPAIGPHPEPNPTKSQVLFPLLLLYWNISPSPRPCEICRNNFKWIWWGDFDCCTVHFHM